MRDYTLAQSSESDACYPVQSLRPLRDFSGIEEGEEPLGEDPVLGAPAHELELELPNCFQHFIDVLAEANASEEVIIAFDGIPTHRVVSVRHWSTPRRTYSDCEGNLGTIRLPMSEEGASNLRAYLMKLRRAQHPENTPNHNHVYLSAHA